MQDMHTSSSSTAPTSNGDTRPRPLPNLSIPGDLVYFLDDLLEVAVRELGRDPEEVVAEVVSRGLASFIASIPEPDRERLGLDATRFQAEATSEQRAACSPSNNTAAESDGALVKLQNAKLRLENDLKEERKKSLRLEQDIRQLKLELEEHEVELQPQSLSNGAYESTYTELTHHAFSEKKPTQNEPKGGRPQASPKKTNKKKRHNKGGAQWGKGSPRSGR